MTEFCINYSVPAGELYRLGQIPLDRFKLPDWPELIAHFFHSGYPFYVHFSLNVGCGKLLNTDWQQVENLLLQGAAPYVNLHLNAPADLNPHDPSAVERYRIHALAEMRQIVQHFGAENVVCENCPLIGDKHHNRAAIDPQFITQLILESGCGFLFDYSHARLAARALGMDENDYIARLPFQRLRELHITGIRTYQGHEEDHFELDESDWAKVDWLQAQIETGQWPRPDMITFEYGGMGPVFEFRTERAAIAEQTPRLYRIFSRPA